MGMRRHMRVAAAASILFLAAGTGAAQAQNPLFDQESYLAGWRVMAAIGRVDVEVIEITISDTVTDTLTIKWVLNNVDASIADLGLSGYCAKAKVGDGSWNEECFSGAPAYRLSYPRVTTTYYMTMNNDDWPDTGIHSVTVQVKVKYDHGDGVWTSWSDERVEWESFTYYRY